MHAEDQGNVSAMLATFAPDRAEGVAAAISDYLRGLIRTGAMEPGTRIPPTERLACWWGVNGRTVHAGLAPLVKEGLIVRKPRCGTFVRSPGVGLRNVAVYDVRSFHDAPDSVYVRVLQTSVQEVLAEDGLLAQVWMDTRPRRQEPWAELEAACRQREVDAVLAVYARAGEAEWLAKLPVPVTFAFLETNRPANVVETDVCQQYELALRELAARGCRSVGLISWAVAEGCIRPPVQRAYDHFFDVIAELGLETRQAWLPHPERNRRPDSSQFHGQYGYEQFKALWETDLRPEGLFVDDDVVARGVVQAVLETGARVPGELELVMYRNRETAAFCPLPTTFVEVSLREVARAAVEQVRGQLRGEKGARVLVPARSCRDGEEHAERAVTLAQADHSL